MTIGNNVVGVVIKEIKPSSKSGCSNLILMDGSVLSVQPDGSLQNRPSGTDGSFEQCQITGNLAAYYPFGTPYVVGFVLGNLLL